MTRVNLTDDFGSRTGEWFNIDSAIQFMQATYWNGNNQVSRATGSQFEDENLFLTKGKRWILIHDTVYAGREAVVQMITPQEAAEWLIVNEYSEESSEFEDMPSDTQKAIAKHFADLEVA